MKEHNKTDYNSLIF